MSLPVLDTFTDPAQQTAARPPAAASAAQQPTRAKAHGHAGGIALSGYDLTLRRSAAAWSARGSAAEDLRVYLIWIDSLRPDEVNSMLTPSIWGLRQAGTWYESVSVLPSSSTQNTAAMLTGALPQDNGFPMESRYLHASSCAGVFLMVAGGHPWLTRRKGRSIVGFEKPTAAKPADPVGRPSVLSIAPTIAWLFGLGRRPYYENRPLIEAFDRDA